jgi:hypothetical protein
VTGAAARPHRARPGHGADAEAPIEAAGEERALPCADEPVLRRGDPLQGRAASRRARAHRGARAVRSGAIAVEGAQRARNPARPARPPPERTAALRHLRVADAARLRDQPARHDLRLLRLLRPSREEDRLHSTRGARAGCGTPGRGLLRLDHDQRRRLPAPRRRGRRRVRQAQRGRDQEFADLTANRARLEAESDKLLAAHFADAIDLPTLKRHQDRIRAGLADIEQRLREHDEQHTGGGRSSTTACGSSPTRTTPTRTPTTGAGGWRTKRSTRAWRSPRTSSYVHASQSHSQRSSARRPEARKPNGNTPHLPMSRVPVRHIGWS